MAAAKNIAPRTERSEVIEKIIVTNRKATFNYTIEDKFEGGLVLVGSEVKSMRGAKVSLMPDGLETGMTHQDMADLIRYLRHQPGVD